MRVLISFAVAVALMAQTSATHQLKATSKTVVWGYYSADASPALRINSGDTVEIETVRTSSPKRLEGAGVPADQVEPSLRAIYKEVRQGARRPHPHRACIHRRR